MKLQDYRSVDCTKFRTPPIDLGRVRSAIDDALLAAWQNGQTAQDAVAEILQNPEISDKLVETLAPNLSFQREVALENVAAQREDAKNAYGAAYQAQLEEIEGTLGKTAEEQAAAYQKRRVVVEEGRAGYSAAEARLTELRQRVQGKLGQFGGTEGFQALLDIHYQVAKDEPEPKPYVAPAPEYTPPQPAQQAVEEKPQTPIPKKTVRLKRRSFWRRFMSLFIR